MVYEMVQNGPKDDPFAKVGVVSSNLIARSNNRIAIKHNYRRHSAGLSKILRRHTVKGLRTFAALSLLQFLGAKEADVFVGFGCVVQFPGSLGKKHVAAIAVCRHRQPVALAEGCQGRRVLRRDPAGHLIG